MPVNDEKISLKKQGKTPGLVFDLVGTSGVTLATALAAAASVALLARIVEREEFLSYTLLLRYFSLAVVVLGIGTGFSFIGRDGKQRGDSDTTSILLQALLISVGVGFVVWVPVSIWLTTNSSKWPSWTLISYVWVFAHTLFILSGPAARASGGVISYVKLALSCRTVPYGAGVLLTLLTGNFLGLFVGYGLCSLYFLWRFWSEKQSAFKYSLNGFSLDWQVAMQTLRFGATRWLDDIVRTLLPVALIVVTGLSLGGDEAAVVALVYLVARVMESMLQPLVIAIMMRNRAAVLSLKKDLWRVVIFSLAITLVLFFFRPLLEYLFVLYLGTTYQDLAGHGWLMLLSAGSIICLSYLRAVYDNSFKHSPLLLINLAAVASLVIAVWWCDTTQEVILFAVLAHIARLVCYAITLIMLIGRRTDVNVS